METLCFRCIHNGTTTTLYIHTTLFLDYYYFYYYHLVDIFWSFSRVKFPKQMEFLYSYEK